MKAALTVWENRISPVFDVSREALIVEVENRAVVHQERFAIPARTALDKISRLKEKGVEVLICGAISEPLYRELTFQQITVNGFVVGPIDEVLQALIDGTLDDERFLMPGCGTHRGNGRLRKRNRCRNNPC